MKTLFLLFTLLFVSNDYRDKEVVYLEDDKTITIVSDNFDFTVEDVVIDGNNTIIYLK